MLLFIINIIYLYLSYRLNIYNCIGFSNILRIYPHLLVYLFTQGSVPHGHGSLNAALVRLSRGSLCCLALRLFCILFSLTGLTGYGCQVALGNQFEKFANRFLGVRLSSMATEFPGRRRSCVD